MVVAYVLMWTTHHWIIKKNKVKSSVRNWVELEVIELREITQTQKGRYRIFLLICRTYEKKKEK